MQCTVIFIVVLGALGAGMGVDLVAEHDGQPGCFIRYEFTRLWRNNFDQHAFWRCELWGVGAIRHECPPYTSFQDAWQTCLPNDSWQWTPYSEPPTRPEEELLDQCEPIENPTPCPTNPPITTPTPEWNSTTPIWNTTTPSTNETDPTNPPCPTCPPVSTTTPEWNTTTPDWNNTTPEWNTTTPAWNNTTPEWNTTTPAWNNTTNEVNTTTPEFSTTTPNWNATTPIDNESSNPPCPTCPPPPTTTPSPCPTCPPGSTEAPSTPPTQRPPDGDIIGICPGAAEHQYQPGPHDCKPPPCSWDQWLNGTLYPTRDPTKFFQCGPDVGNLYVMPCGPETCFSFDEQVCVHVVDWKNPCTAPEEEAQYAL